MDQEPQKLQIDDEINIEEQNRKNRLIEIGCLVLAGLILLAIIVVIVRRCRNKSYKQPTHDHYDAIEPERVEDKTLLEEIIPIENGSKPLSSRKVLNCNENNCNKTPPSISESASSSEQIKFTTREEEDVDSNGQLELVDEILKDTVRPLPSQEVYN